MNHKVTLFFACILSGISLLAQPIQVYDENFETGGWTFTTNGIGVGTNTGNNQWIVNKNYAGGGAVPNSMTEDSTYGGTIAYAPDGNYLHIYDQASTYTNCNYNPAAASDRFAYMQSGVCTRGIYNVNLNFFYLCQGSPTAYGEVYYSANNGAWIKIGNAQYTNKHKWQYSTISDPAFDNVSNLRVGFRWQNDNAVGTDTAAFGIDDVSILGVYDSIVRPVHINVTASDSVCQGQFLWIKYKLSDTLCDGTYTIQLSDANGSFNNPPLTWVSWIYYPQDSGNIPLQIPTTGVAPGTCYKVRFIRTSPAPSITGYASNCFSIVACPNTITTLQPIITTDTNAVCAGSVIDVPFYSTGKFYAANKYVAHLSDSSGSFTTTYDTIGIFQNSGTYDPSVGSSPGTVSGLIPKDAVPGCNYYIRVISTAPPYTGSVWGPFCIQRCDLNSNQQKNISECIQSCNSGPAGVDDTVTFNIHEYDSLANYSAGNIFKIELLSGKTFLRVNLGGLGIKADTISGKIYVHIPCADSLLMKGIQSGLYYLRMIATSSSFPDSSLGSLVHLTIGIPADSIKVYPDKSSYCTGDVAQLFASPWNFESTYAWQNNGSTIPWTSNPLYLNLAGYVGNLNIKVRETNYGCNGPWSNIKTIKVKGPPNVTISGPVNLCLGDTGTYKVSFTNNTQYKWRAPFASALDTSSNTVKVRFDSAGTFKIYVVGVDSCGADSGFRTIKVKPIPVPVITGTTSGCVGTSVTLTASGGTTYQWSNGSGNATINITLIKDTTYYVTAKNGSCIASDTVKLTALPLPVVTATPAFKMVCPGDSAAITATGATKYLWLPPVYLNTDTGNVVISKPASAVTYTITGSFANMCSDTATVTIQVDTPWANIFGPTTGCSGKIVSLIASGGTVYNWSDGSTNDTLNVTLSNTVSYYVTVSNGVCPATDTIDIVVLPAPVVQINPAYTFICPGDSVTLTATGAQQYNWLPNMFLSSDTGSTVIAVVPSGNITYTVLGSSGNGCTDTSTTVIQVSNSSSTVSPSITIPDGQSTPLLATGGISYLWIPNTGLSCDSCPNPISMPAQTTTYTVVVTDSLGCVMFDYVTVDLEAKVGDFFFPTAFSPNNDGQNDILFVRCNCTRSLLLKIFDRWGNKVFETTDPSKGWDGSYLGWPMNTGVFAYEINATLLNNEKVSKKGNITLVR